MKIYKQLFVFLLAICISTIIKANNGDNGEKKNPEGTVNGYVMDAVTRKPVHGVTVCVSSNKLQNGQEMKSDASGYFHFAKLPVGQVTLMFEKKGYKLFKRNVLPVKDGTVIKISVEVQPIPGKEEDNELWHPLFKLLY